MLSFGHAVYMGIGGFVAVHVMNIVENEYLWLPLPLLPLVGGLVGLGFATIIGSFSTRKAGTVFAMISLGIGELIAACCIIITVFFGGEEDFWDGAMAPQLVLNLMPKKSLFSNSFLGSSITLYVSVANTRGQNSQCCKR